MQQPGIRNILCDLYPLQLFIRIILLTILLFRLSWTFQNTKNRASIDSQKQSDEYNRPNLFTHLYYLQDEPRQAAYNVYSNMSSYFKGRQGGAASSFATVDFYNKQAKNKRAALLEKYKAEAELAAHTSQE